MSAGTPGNTLLLDPVSGDLVVDANGNIAIASPPYSLAQDAASAIKTFQNEVYYDTRQGVPYFTQVLKKSPPPLAIVKQLLVQAAVTSVPGVTAAQVFFSGVVNRSLVGQVQTTDTQGNLAAVNF